MNASSTPLRDAVNWAAIEAVSGRNSFANNHRTFQHL